MSRRSHFSVHPRLLAALAILSGLLLISHYSADRDESAAGRRIPPEEVFFLQVRFEEPGGMTIDLDATEHNAMELRDAWLITPVDLTFRMNAEFQIRLHGVPLGSSPDGEIQGRLATRPPPEDLSAEFFKLTTMRVEIDERDRTHLMNGTTVSLVYYLPAEENDPPPDGYLPPAASPGIAGDELLNEFEYGELIAVLRLQKSTDDGRDPELQGDVPAEVLRLCSIDR